MCSLLTFRGDADLRNVNELNRGLKPCQKALAAIWRIYQ